MVSTFVCGSGLIAAESKEDNENQGHAEILFLNLNITCSAKLFLLFQILLVSVEYIINYFDHVIFCTTPACIFRWLR